MRDAKRRLIRPLTEEEKKQRKLEADRKFKELEQKRLAEHLADLKSKVKAYDRLQALIQTYPDLRVETDRWGKIRYCSAKVNSVADKIEFRRSCGCCPDAEILALPYLETGLGPVYTYPTRFKLGEGALWGSAYEKPDWQEPCREAGLSEAVIAEMGTYLQGTIARSREDNDD